MSITVHVIVTSLLLSMLTLSQGWSGILFAQVSISNPARNLEMVPLPGPKKIHNRSSFPLRHALKHIMQGEINMHLKPEEYPNLAVPLPLNGFRGKSKNGVHATAQVFPKTLLPEIDEDGGLRKVEPLYGPSIVNKKVMQVSYTQKHTQYSSDIVADREAGEVQVDYKSRAEQDGTHVLGLFSSQGAKQHIYA